MRGSFKLGGRQIWFATTLHESINLGRLQAAELAFVKEFYAKNGQGMPVLIEVGSEGAQNNFIGEINRSANLKLLSPYMAFSDELTQLSNDFY